MPRRSKALEEDLAEDLEEEEMRHISRERDLEQTLMQRDSRLRSLEGRLSSEGEREAELEEEIEELREALAACKAVAKKPTSAAVERLIEAAPALAEKAPDILSSAISAGKKLFSSWFGKGGRMSPHKAMLMRAHRRSGGALIGGRRRRMPSSRGGKIIGGARRKASPYIAFLKHLSKQKGISYKEAMEMASDAPGGWRALAAKGSRGSSFY